MAPLVVGFESPALPLEEHLVLWSLLGEVVPAVLTQAPDVEEIICCDALVSVCCTVTSTPTVPAHNCSCDSLQLTSACLGPESLKDMDETFSATEIMALSEAEKLCFHFFMPVLRGADL